MNLKLRVFANGKMTYLNHIRIDGFTNDVEKTEIKVTFEEKDNYPHYFHDDFANDTPVNPIIMQNTGLKDGLDKELFYGDLIVFYYGHRKENMVWDICDITDIEYIFNSVNERGASFEIIGNKYENPDLLK